MRVYALYFNITLEPDQFLKNPITPAPTDVSLLRLKISIDNALLKYVHNESESTPEIEASFSNYPMPSDRFLSGFSIISLTGTLYFLFTPMVTFMIIIIEIAKEKELRLRHVIVLSIMVRV